MAFGPGTINSAGGAASDLFAGEAAKASADATATGLRLKASGDIAEATNYDLAAGLSDENLQYAKTSTAIQQMQADRELSMSIGGQRADVAGAGFASSGSALDLMRDSASQGALNKAVLGEQGLITEAGYQEQGTAYRNMSTAARYAAGVEDEMATSAEEQGKKAERNGEITAGIKAASAVASVFI